MMGGQTIAAVVMTHNEERNIRQCLETLKWADEIVVVDSFSTDETLRIAGEYTDRIFQREWAGYVDQGQYALEQATADWAIWLDADERLTPEARREIERWFERPGGPDCEGFAFPRKTFLIDRWINHSGWYPQHRVRLFRRDAGRIGGTPPHSSAIVEGRIRRLRGEILHHSYPGGVTELMRKSAGFAQTAARERYRRGERFSLMRCLLKPPYHFVRRLLFQGGFLDGIPGLAISASAAYYRFVRELRLWDLEHARPPEPAEPDRPAGED